MAIAHLEHAWLESDEPGDALALVDAVRQAGGWAEFVGGAVFIQEPLPALLGQALELHRRVTAPLVGQGQKVLIDLLLFRVLSTARFHHADAAIAVELDQAVLTASPLHTPAFEEPFEALAPTYSFQVLDRGHPINPGVFRLDPVALRGALPNLGLNLSEWIRLRDGLLQLDAVVADAVHSARVANQFEVDEPLSIFWVNDDAHDHGFIRTPWRVSFGRHFALAEIRRGTWY